MQINNCHFVNAIFVFTSFHLFSVITAKSLVSEARTICGDSLYAIGVQLNCHSLWFIETRWTLEWRIIITGYALLVQHISQIFSSLIAIDLNRVSFTRLLHFYKHAYTNTDKKRRCRLRICWPLSSVVDVDIKPFWREWKRVANMCNEPFGLTSAWNMHCKLN